MSDIKFSDLTLSSAATSSGVLVWKPPAYTCPKHGLVNDGIGTLNLHDANGNLISRHCIKCYQEWIAENIPQVETP